MNPPRVPSVAITDWSFPDLSVEEAIINAAGLRLVASRCQSEQELIDLCQDADAVITQFAKVNGNVVGGMQRASAIVRYGIGVDNVDLDAAKQAGIPVCNIPDYCVDEVADHTLSFLLATTRQVVSNTLFIRGGQWGLATPLGSMQALKYLTIGVVGFGRIGREVVKRLVAFKARVLVLDPIAKAEDVRAAGAEPASSIESMLPQCDVLTLHCPSLPSTRRMINAQSLASMKPGAILINVSRGDLVDSAALIDALKSNHLSAAALDVFDPEPIPADSPLRSMPNVILAAHIASASPAAVMTLRQTAARLAVMAVKGEPLPSIVNGLSAARRVS